MHIASFEELVSYLRKDGVPVDVDPKAHLVEVPARCGNLCLRWDERVPVIQIVCAIYTGVSLSDVPRVADLVTRWNHDLPLPGLGVDREAGMVYYRGAIARGAAGLAVEQLLAVLALVVDQIAGLRPVLEEAMRLPPARPTAVAPAIIDISARFAA